MRLTNGDAPQSGQWMRVAAVIKDEWEVGSWHIRHNEKWICRELVLRMQSPSGESNEMQCGYAALPITSDYDKDMVDIICQKIKHKKYLMWKNIEKCREVNRMVILRGR